MFLDLVKNYSLVTEHACLEYKKIVHTRIYTSNVFTLQTQMTSQEFAHEHVFKGLNDR